jgi:hypothetical protein
MSWKRHAQISTRRTWWEAINGPYMIQASNSGWYECWCNGEYFGGSGLLGGAMNLCETHAKESR